MIDKKVRRLSSESGEIRLELQVKVFTPNTGLSCSELV